MRVRRLFLSLSLSLLLWPLATLAQTSPVPENVVQLQASASVEVAQDLLGVSLQATREGPDATQVQAQLKTVLEQALAEARRAARPGLEVRSGGFSVAPRNGRDGRITAWVGTAELLIEGTDATAVAALAGRLNGLAITASQFRLSRAAREQAERQAQGEAVAAFRARAGALAQAFGFANWTLREVSVDAGEAGQPRPRMLGMAMVARSAEAAPLPVEAGHTAVTVTVSGSVQLR